MKKIIMLMVLLFASPAFADYTVELKNEVGAVIKTYNITTNQVAHLQKTSTLTGVSVLDQFEGAIISLIQQSKAYNKAMWKRTNDAYIDEQSRQ